MFDLIKSAENAKKASLSLNALSDSEINKALKLSAKLIRDKADYLKQENKKDIDNTYEKGLSEAFIDRLTLTDTVIEGIAVGIEQVAELESPRNKVLYSYYNENQKIDVKKIVVPFGVIGIIYESRPNVTADAFALCFKTANAVMLKGGSDAINSNTAIANVIREALTKCGIDENALTLIKDTSRETTVEFMKLNGYVDLLIPRGGGSLINSALENSTIPIIETGKGNCHVYVDEFADIDMAVKVIYNAKTQRYSVCNACESLVIHKAVLNKALPKIAEELKVKQVVIACDEKSYQAIPDYPYLRHATVDDYGTEYGKAEISVKTVDSLAEAIEHINLYSTKHSESIITENLENAEKFIESVDSSCVYHNASTRFSDGFVFGLGAEIGISTQKLHARGPMGLDGLVTTKYVIKGNGAIRKS